MNEDNTQYNAFAKEHALLGQLAVLYEQSYTEDPTSSRTKAFRRLCRSQVTAVRHAMTALIEVPEKRED